MLADPITASLLVALRDGPRRFSQLRVAVKNPRTLSSRLKHLFELQLLTKQGPLYVLTERGEEALHHVERLQELVEAKPFSVSNLDRVPHRVYQPLIEKYCHLLHQELGSKLRAIVLFGSVARGDWDKGSDIDLLVVAENWKIKAWKRIIELQSVKERLRSSGEFVHAVEEGFSAAIQHYPLSLEEAEKFHRIYLDMCLDGIILYDPDGLMKRILEETRKSLAANGARRVSLPLRGYYWVLKSEVN